MVTPLCGHHFPWELQVNLSSKRRRVRSIVNMGGHSLWRSKSLSHSVFSTAGSLEYSRTGDRVKILAQGFWIHFSTLPPNSNIFSNFWEEPSMDQCQSREKLFMNFQRWSIQIPWKQGKGAIGPHEFPLKFIWTNGSQISLKVWSTPASVHRVLFPEFSKLSTKAALAKAAFDTPGSRFLRSSVLKTLRDSKLLRHIVFTAPPIFTMQRTLLWEEECL